MWRNIVLKVQFIVTVRTEKVFIFKGHKEALSANHTPVTYKSQTKKLSITQRIKVLDNTVEKCN